MVRGNTVMLGYLKEPKATAGRSAAAGCAAATSRSSTPTAMSKSRTAPRNHHLGRREHFDVEVEIALYRHPAVLLAAVVARPDQKWGETPCAFVQLRPGADASADEIIAFCREQLAHFKAPKSVVFGALPTTATGKIQNSSYASAHARFRARPARARSRAAPRAASPTR